MLLHRIYILSMRAHFQRLSTQDNWTIFCYILLLALLDYFPGRCLLFRDLMIDTFLLPRRGQRKTVVVSFTLLPLRFTLQASPEYKPARPIVFFPTTMDCPFYPTTNHGISSARFPICSNTPLLYGRGAKKLQVTGKTIPIISFCPEM